MANVLISGGTGLIGSHLSKYLAENGFDVVILSRNKNPASANPKISYSYWNVKDKVIDKEVVKKADHIVHLAGAGGVQHAVADRAAMQWLVVGAATGDQRHRARPQGLAADEFVPVAEHEDVGVGGDETVEALGQHRVHRIDKFLHGRLLPK